MKKINSKIVSRWYRKSTDTGVVLNFNAVVPKIYLSRFVSGFVRRFFNACSNWEEINKSWAEAEKILTNNQYPKQFISKILNSTLTKINSNGQSEDHNNISKKTNPTLNHWLSLEYRGKSSQNFAFKLKKLLPSVNIVFTTNTLRNVVSPEKCRSVCPEVSCSV